MANTFTLPSTGKSLALSRIDWNEFLRSIASHAYGENIPISTNFTDEGVTVSPYTGFLHRNSKLNALYIYDSTKAKGGGLGSGYTRQGIGSRNFEDIANLVSNLAFVEQAELLTTVGDASANYRLYMKTNNSNSIVDVGIPPASSLSSGMFVDRQISNVRLVAASITNNEIAAATITADKIHGSVTFGGNNNAVGVGSGSSLVAGMSGSSIQLKSVTVTNTTSGALASGVYQISHSDNGSTITIILTRGTAVGVGVGK